MSRSAPRRFAAPRLPLATLLAAAALLLAACDQKDSANAQPAAPPPPQVGVRTLHAQTVHLTTELPGRTVAYRKAEVRPQVDGIVQKRLFEEGARVEAGQPLYQIDPASYQAAVKAAEADLARAKASLASSSTKAKRYKELIGRKAVSQQDYDDILATEAENKADVAAAEAKLEQTRINLEYTVVTAPIGGRIGRSAVTEGALVTANQDGALATITQLDPIYVDVTESSAELLRTRRAIAEGEITVTDKGDVPVRLHVDATGSDYPQEGRVQFSEVVVNETTGTVSLRAVFPNPQRELMPGLFVRAIVSQGEARQAFLVPQAAVVRGSDGRAFVWRIGEDGKAERRPVTVRRAVGGDWLVTEGLADGDRIAVDGLQRIRPGSPVTPVDLDAKQAPAQPKATGAAAASS